jgi:hypothetical protein
MDTNIPAVWSGGSAAFEPTGFGNERLQCVASAKCHCSHTPAAEVSTALQAAEVFDGMIRKWPRNGRFQNLVYVNVDHGAFAHRQGSNCVVFHPAASRLFSFVAHDDHLPPGFQPLQQVRV